MSLSPGSVFVLPTMLMLALGLLPTRVVNGVRLRLRNVVVALVAAQFVAALTAMPWAMGVWQFGGEVSAEAGLAGSVIHLDGVSTLMLALVSFVGFVVSKYSVRYLDGDARQGQFFRWMALTIGAVSLMIVSGNLALIWFSWVLTSLGLHQLLVYYADRPAAQDAAWTKFAVSRFGDVLLAIAFFLCYRVFGTMELSGIFSAIKNGSFEASPMFGLAAWLIVAGAAVKSAQFPVHIWLPNTLEAPTPVSALMHAGIVNAGGYMVVRLSPVLVETPAALSTLAIVGGITVLYAGLTMMTQSSVKRGLAYSTIAQMGFMMLQCGLGAFSAAMLHIVAHSLYKAYAFLNSGNVLRESAGRRSPSKHNARRLTLADYSGGLLLGGAAVVFACIALGADIAGKSGGYLLCFVLTLALTAWLWSVLQLDSIRATFVGICVTTALPFLYVLGFLATDAMLKPDLAVFDGGWLHTTVSIAIGFIFCGLLAASWALRSDTGRQKLMPMYVHASNGFYIDAVLWRAIGVKRTGAAHQRVSAVPS